VNKTLKASINWKIPAAIELQLQLQLQLGLSHRMALPYGTESIEKATATATEP
jgi:hypothetical protein